MTPPSLEEYKALRVTIGQRGTARIYLFATGLVAWGALTVATAALAALPIATLLPLLVLGCVFEAIYSLHIGVVRIGRYLQVFFEESETDGSASASWERAAMAFGRPAGAARSDPLFAAYFIAAAILNFVPAAIAEPVPLEAGVVGAAHVFVIIRVLVARRAAGRQRAIDLDRFRQLKREIGG
jgi:hypothetical protein